MKSHLKIVRLADRTPEWFEYRLGGIGASEVGGVMSLDEYKTVARIFDEKTGRVDQWTEPNKNTHWGIAMEDLVAENWQYYDGTPEGYIKHADEGNIQRKCKRINGYVTNPKYPWLYVSLDRVINNDQFCLNSELLTTGEPPLEIKTINPMALAKYEAGLPVSHIAQLHAQMIVTETDYSEIAIFDCLRNLHVFEVPFSKKFADGLLEATQTFWETMVVPAKALVEEQKKATTQDEIDRIEAEIVSFEPEPEDTEAYKQYMKEKYTGDASMIKGEMSQFMMAKRYKYLNEIKKGIAARQREEQNKLMRYMENSEIIDFDGSGRVDWKADVNGVRRFAVRIKNYTPDKDEVAQQVSQIKIP